MISVKKRILVSSLLIPSSFALAQNMIVSDPSTLLGPIAAARGASSLAGSLRHDSLLLNPAAAANEPLYSVSANYGALGDLMSASIVDTKSGPVGGGAYYLRRDTSGGLIGGALGSSRRIEEQAGLSLMGNIMESVSVGILGRYQKNRVLNSGVSAQSEWEGDAGITWRALRPLRLAAIARNLLREKSGLTPKMYGFGLDYVPYPGISLNASATKIVLDDGDTTFDAGVVNPSEDTSYAVGAEWHSLSGFIFRAGVNFLRPWDQTIASGGLGFLDKGFSVHYAYSKSVEGASYDQHLFGLGYEF